MQNSIFYLVSVAELTDLSLGSFMFFFCLVFVMSLCASVYLCLVVTCLERAHLLFVLSNCELAVIFPLVFWVRCGT